MSLYVLFNRVRFSTPAQLTSEVVKQPIMGVLKGITFPGAEFNPDAPDLPKIVELRSKLDTGSRVVLQVETTDGVKDEIGVSYMFSEIKRKMSDAAEGDQIIDLTYQDAQTVSPYTTHPYCAP